MNLSPVQVVLKPITQTSRAYILQLWWWPTFVFVYPLLFTTLGNQSRIELILAKYFLGLLALIGGALIEWSYRSPPLNSLDYRNKRTALFDFNGGVILVFGLWCLVVSLTSPEPIIALTGSIAEKSDASIWLFTLSLCSWLIYLQGKRHPHILIRVFYAVAFSGGLLAFLALAEIIFGQGLLYKVTREALPMTTFPQKGHLSGFFVLCFGVSLTAWRWNNRLIYVSALLCCLGIGLCFNRASVLAVFLSILLCLVVNWRKYMVLALLSGVFIFLGWGAVQIFNVQGTRELASSGTVISRSYMWKAGLNGIIERPLTGWGGGYFQRVWIQHISLLDLKKYMKLEYNATLIKLDGELLITLNSDGTKSAAPFAVWKSHNQFIEVALLYGIPGLLLYLLVLFRLFKAGGLRNPAVIGVFAYHVFFMLWFSIPESDGVLWALIGAGMAGLPAARAPETSILEPSPPLHSSS